MSNSRYNEIATGAIGPNPNKVKGDKRPDFTGSVTLNGDKMNLSVWKQYNVERKKEYYTFSISKPKLANPTGYDDNFQDEDIPF